MQHTCIAKCNNETHTGTDFYSSTIEWKFNPKQAKKQVIINLVVNRGTNSKFLFVITLEEILKRIN